MRVTKRNEFYLAYLLDEEAFSRLQNILCVASQQATWLVHCEDNSHFTCNNLAEVLGILNTPERNITSIHVFTTANTDNRVEATFRDFAMRVPKSFPAIDYKVSGDESMVLQLSSNLEELVLGQRQWYPCDFCFWIVSAIGGIAGASIFALLLHFLHHPSLWLVYGISLILGPLVGVRASKWVTNLFPAGSFLIGKGKDRHEVRKFVRGIVLMGLGIATAGAVIGGFIYDAIKVPSETSSTSLNSPRQK